MDIEKLVKSIAKKYIGRNVPLEELEKAGMEGVEKLKELNLDKINYDVSNDDRLEWFVRQAITRKVADNTPSNVKVSTEMIGKINAYQRAARSLTQENGIEPTIEEIANKMEISNQEVTKIQEFLKKLDEEA